MKLSLALSTVLSILATRVDSFATTGGYALARHATSTRIAANTALPVLSRAAIETLPAGNPRQRRRTGALGMSTVVVPADFNLPIGFAAVGLAITGAGQVGVGFPLSVVGLALAFQATRVSFVFDDESMEVKIGDEAGKLKSSGENAFVGGESRWRYDTWTNWEVYPSEKLPILMYFKETQTKPEGQIHFFPFIMQADVLLEEVRARVPQVAK